MIKHFGTLTYCFTFAVLTILTHHILAHDALAATGQKQTSSVKHANDAIPPRGKQASGTPKGPKSAHGTNDKRGKRTAGKVGRADVAQIPIPSPKPAPPLTGDLGAIKQALELVRKGQTAEATVIENMLDDEVAQKLIEWFVLRHPNGGASFRRYAAFIDENPNWPSMPQLRRRAEGRLWQEKSDAARVHQFTADRPVSGAGRLALARVLLNEGDRDGAAREAREAWRSQKLSERTEGEALKIFGDLLTREDHLARMDKRIGAKDLAGASRAAARVGSDGAAIIKACVAAAGNSCANIAVPTS